MSAFNPRSADDIVRLVDDFPLAWLVSIDVAGSVLSSQLPLIRLDAGPGARLKLLGHMARTNPLVERLRSRPRAALLFSGPDGYVSPSWYSNRDSAPTWAYVNVTFTVDINFSDELIDEALSKLVDRMELERPRGWTINEVRHRYAELSARVIAFTATVLHENARFKLMQDEPQSVVRETLVGLGDGPLSDWIGAFNSDRLGPTQ